MRTILINKALEIGTKQMRTRIKAQGVKVFTTETHTRTVLVKVNKTKADRAKKALIAMFEEGGES